MTTLCNVTEARNNLSNIGLQLRPGRSVTFLRNGKVLFVGISQKDFEKYQQYETEEKKVKTWERTLPTRQATEEEELAFTLYEKEKTKLTQQRGLSAKEVMSLI